jgi:hypothetical protein
MELERQENVLVVGHQVSGNHRSALVSTPFVFVLRQAILRCLYVPLEFAFVNVM